MTDKIKVLLIKKHALSIIVLLIIGSTGLFMNRNEILYYTRGVEQYKNQDFKTLQGKYVEYDLQDIKLVECFMMRTQKRLLSKEKNYYYYLAGVKKKYDIHFFIMMIPEDDKEVFDDYVEAFSKNKTGDSYKLVAKCMEQDEYLSNKLSYETDMFEYNRYGEVCKEKYYLVKTEPPVFMIPLLIIYIICIVYALIRLFIIKFSSVCGGEQMQHMNNDYEYSRFFTDRIRIGDAYMYFFQKNGNVVLKNSNIMWMYECSVRKEENGIKSGHFYNGIEIWDDEFNSYQIENIKKQTIDDILNYVVNNFPFILVGYSEKLDNMYIYQNEQFKDIVYNTNNIREGEYHEL